MFVSNCVESGKDVTMFGLASISGVLRSQADEFLYVLFFHSVWYIPRASNRCDKYLFRAVRQGPYSFDLQQFPWTKSFGRCSKGELRWENFQWLQVWYQNSELTEDFYFQCSTSNTLVGLCLLKVLYVLIMQPGRLGNLKIGWELVRPLISKQAQRLLKYWAI